MESKVSGGLGGTCSLNREKKLIRWGREREEEKERVLERETPPSLQISRRSDRQFQAEQEEEFILSTRASHRDRNLRASTNSKR